MNNKSNSSQSDSKIKGIKAALTQREKVRVGYYRPACNRLKLKATKTAKSLGKEIYSFLSLSLIVNFLELKISLTIWFQQLVSVKNKF